MSAHRETAAASPKASGAAGLAPSREQIWSDLQRILIERLRVRPLKGPATILADLELDSVGLLSLVVELENHFRICFEPGEEQGITTLSEVVDLVQAHLAAVDP